MTEREARECERILAGRGFRLIRSLGSGAFAEVFLVQDQRGRSFACKISSHVALLEREAAFQAESSHSLFPEMTDFFSEEGKGCLLMEYIDGETLKRFLERAGAFPAERAAEIGARLAEGLFSLHRRQSPVIFRDVKPENVMLDRAGRVRLTDFGCACHAGKNPAVAGSPGFGAPEQFEEGAIQTSAVDVYGLGKTLEVLVRREGSCGLRRLLRRCTQECPENRISDMCELAGLFRYYAGDGGRRLTGRQRAVLTGKLAVVKNICI